MHRIDIAPDGDLIFIVAKKLELRVHSFVMRFHVPGFFGALLGPKFAEGQSQGTAAIPHIVQLPEDGAQGMKLLCSILHVRNDLIDYLPTGADFRELALVSDKYDCGMKIQIHVEKWMNAVDISKARLAGSWLHAVYILNDARMFSTMTNKLIRGYHNTQLIGRAFDQADDQDEAFQAIKDSVVSNAKRQRDAVCSSIDTTTNYLIACLSSDFKHSVNEIPHVDRAAPEPDEMDDRTEWSQMEEQCGYLQKYVVAQLGALVDAMIFPPNRRPRQLQSLLENISAFESADVKKSERCHSRRGWCDEDCTDEFPDYVETMKDKAAALTCALCLDCLKAGGWNDDKCRVHPSKKRSAKN